MDETDGEMRRSSERARRLIVSAALLGSGVLAGGVLVGSQVANAQAPSATDRAARRRHRPT